MHELKLRWLICPLILVVLIWIATWFVLPAFGGFKNLNELGAFGGMFGVISALFSGLAFAALVYTIRHQVLTSRLAQQEFKTQVKQTRQSQFESFLFQLIQQLNLTLENIQANNKKGDEAVIYCKKIFDIELGSKNNSEIYKKYYDNLGHSFTSFWRQLAYLLKFIDSSKASYSNDYDIKLNDVEYRDLIRILLSEDMLTLTFYHAFLAENTQDLKVVTHKAGLFDKLRKNKIIKESHYLVFEQLCLKPQEVQTSTKSLN